jgi:hypothetical protein
VLTVIAQGQGEIKMNKEMTIKVIKKYFDAFKKGAMQEINKAVIREALDNEKLREKNTKVIVRYGKKVNALDNAFDFIRESKNISQDEKDNAEIIGKALLSIKLTEQSPGKLGEIADLFIEDAEGKEINEKYVEKRIAVYLFRFMSIISDSENLSFNFTMYPAEGKTTVLEMLTSLKDDLEKCDMTVPGEKEFEEHERKMNNDSKN